MHNLSSISRNRKHQSIAADHQHPVQRLRRIARLLTREPDRNANRYAIAALHADALRKLHRAEEDAGVGPEDSY